ncbi:SHD1 domain-containing protein [Novipirellula caenicola]|uniref:SLA1 homology domain-containing protein n=1 Tax=Novipirellula caenicola TaxID=1536901 RepID=A0ABP9VS15_9BACT
MTAARLFRGSFVLPIAIVVLAFLNSSQAQSPGKPNRDVDFAIGDRVEVRQGNKWIEGEVLESMRGGLVKVQLDSAPASRVLRIPRQLIRRAYDTKSATTANQPRDGQPPTALRLWTDSTGQHKVEAEFVEVTEGKVTLRKKDGSQTVLPLERLCEEDRAFIASQIDEGGDASPEDVLRQFLVALAGGNRRQVVTLILPHPNAAVLLQGEAAPPQVVAEMKKQIASEEIRRLKLGEKVSLPGGRTMTVGDEDVSTERVLLQIPNHPIPYSLIRKKNGWRVDAAPIIQARVAALAARDKIETAGRDRIETAARDKIETAMRDKGGAAAPVSDDKDSAAKPSGDWHTVTAIDGRVRIQLPGKPTRTDQVTPISQGSVTFEIYKVSARGRFWNFHVITYPAAVIDAATDKIEFIARIGNATMRSKSGSESISLTPIKDSAYPAVRLEYRYPPGKNSAGEYGGGQAMHELYLIENQVVWVFVDVLNAAREVENDKVTAEIKRFFASLVIPKD